MDPELGTIVRPRLVSFESQRVISIMSAKPEVTALNARISSLFLIQTEVLLCTFGIRVKKNESQVQIDSAFQSGEKNLAFP